MSFVETRFLEPLDVLFLRGNKFRAPDLVRRHVAVTRLANPMEINRNSADLAGCAPRSSAAGRILKRYRFRRAREVRRRPVGHESVEFYGPGATAFLP